MKMFLSQSRNRKSSENDVHIHTTDPIFAEQPLDGIKEPYLSQSKDDAANYKEQKNDHERLSNIKKSFSNEDCTLSCLSDAEDLHNMSYSVQNLKHQQRQQKKKKQNKVRQHKQLNLELQDKAREWDAEVETIMQTNINNCLTTNSKEQFSIVSTENLPEKISPLTSSLNPFLFKKSNTLKTSIAAESLRYKPIGQAILHFSDLPIEIQYMIFQHLDAVSLGRATCVCSDWRRICNEKKLWEGKRKAMIARKSMSSDSNPFKNTAKPLYRIVVVGAGGVGKSAVTVRFVSGRFVEKYDPTIEDAYRIHVYVDDQPTYLDIIDTAGPEEYSALRDHYIQLGTGFIIVYSITSIQSFNVVSKLRNSILHMKGLSEFDESCFLAPIIVVGNKCDASDQRAVSIEEGQHLANQFSHFSKNFFEVSARVNINISEVFHEIVRQIDTISMHNRAKQPQKSRTCTVM